MKHGNVLCQSCSIKCQILPEQEFSASQCLNPKVCIWPGVNVFFEAGVRSLINSISVITSSEGFVFVDFSWRNIHFFMNDEWVEYLASTNMKIILLADVKMAALANYYKQNEKNVTEVLYLSEGLGATLINFRKVFIGLPLFCRSGRSLTKKERQVLYLTLKHKGVADISTEMSLDVKSVYNIRQRIESKIGMKIRRFT